MNRAERIIKPEPADYYFDEEWGDMGKTITVTTADGHTFSAYTAGDDNATKGIVVIQEIFGVNHHIQDMADKFAAAGYKTIAPAMFDPTTARRASNCAASYRMQTPSKTSRLRRKHSARNRPASSAIALAERCPGMPRPAPKISKQRRAGMAAASPRPRTRSRTVRCKCNSAKPTAAFR
jgi:hypothetical protein